MSSFLSSKWHHRASGFSSDVDAGRDVVAPWVSEMYIVGAGVALAAFAAVGTLLAVTLPYHQWDSFAFGEWSRAIAQHHRFDPLSFGPLTAARPVFYELQGVIWSATGISFSAGRLLSLGFALVLIVSVFEFQRRLTRSRLDASIAAAFVIAIPVFAQQSLAGQTDVPAAAMVALVAMLAVRLPGRQGNGAQVALLLAAAAAVLTKQTVLLALVPFGILLVAQNLKRLSAALRWPVGSLAAGLALGLAYDLLMASRFHEGLLGFLRQGSTGIWAQLAARARTDAILRADVLGAGLRLPLTFGLVYAVIRLVGVRHRYAVGPALALGLAWSVAGPLAAGDGHGAFANSEDAFTLIGFAIILAAGALAPDDDAPSRATLRIGLALGLPPLAIWAQASAYTDRLASAGWPGLAILTAVVVSVGIRGLARAGSTVALAPLAIVAMAVWMSLATFDGLHGSMWVEYRSLGRSGLTNRTRTTHVVLPALQSALALAEPELGNGRLITGDPFFPYFLPGRVDTKTPGRCADVRGYRVFVLLTGDESVLSAREQGRLATPEQWASCRAPMLRQLSDGSNGYAVFAVSTT